MDDIDFIAIRDHLHFVTRHVHMSDCECIAHGLHLHRDIEECVRLAQMNQTSTDLGKFLVEAIELLRWYRSRAHRVDEDEEGGYSPYHRVYGVHRDGMAAADALLARATEWGMLGRQREFH